MWGDGWLPALSSDQGQHRSQGRQISVQSDPRCLPGTPVWALTASLSPLCDFSNAHLVLSTLIRLLRSVLLMRWWSWMMCILGECFRPECFTNFLL